MTAADDTDATDVDLAIVLALAACDPTAADDDRETGGYGTRCTLCDATPRGAARVLLQSQHDPSCPWRRARTFSDDLGRAAST